MYMPPFRELDKGKEDLLKIIRLTKNRLGRLRNKMEHPDYKYRTDKMCPSDLVIYKCDRDFLDEAIIRYIEKGGKYKYSKSELNDMDFNSKLEEISKITFSNDGFFSAEDKTVVDLQGDKPKVFLASFDCLCEKPSDMEKEEFLYCLGKLHIGQWRKEYRTERFGIFVLDGEQWSLKIEYKNGKKKEYSGCNAYPYNFEELLELLTLN